MSKTVHAEVLDLSKVLSKDITIADGKATISKEAYVSTLPEGITKEQVETIQKHNGVFYPAVTHAFGEKAIVAMKKDKALDQLTLETPLTGHDHFDITFSRTKTFPNPATPGESVVKYGVVNAQLVTQAARANRGDMNTIRDILAEKALAALGD